MTVAGDNNTGGRVKDVTAQGHCETGRLNEKTELFYKCMYRCL